MRKASILAALLLVAPAVSQAKTLEDLLVEKGVITKGEAKQAVGSAPAKVYYNNGTRFDFSDVGFTTKINTLIQTRYTFNDQDEEAGGRNTSSFDVERARLYVTGNALHEEFSYGINADFVGDSNDSGEKSASLKDAYIAWHGCDWFTLKTGQFKTGLGRQFNASDYQLQFADRSVTSDYFDFGRQAGATASTDLMDGALKLTAGVFNGESTGEGTNLSGNDTRHTGILSARYNVMGQIDSSAEGDIDWTEDAAADVGVSYAHSSANTVTETTSDQPEGNTVSADVNFKYSGWGFNGEYFVSTTDSDLSDDDVNTQGFYVQGGYFIKPKTLELAARYALIDCDDGAGAGICSGLDSIDEVSASVNYHWWKHNIKAQLGWVWLSEDAGDGADEVEDNRWLIQLSSYL